MRKLLFFLAFALLMTGSAFSQNGVISVDNVTNDYNLGTQLRAGFPHVIGVRYDLTGAMPASSANWTGSNGYELYSPDGADWGSMTATFGPLVNALPGSVVKYAYHYQLVGTTWDRTTNNGDDPCPGASVIDRAGFYLATVDFTGAGYLPGASDIALNFAFSTRFEDDGLTMCFDSLSAITAWEWAAGSAGDFPIWDNGLGASEPRCWEIYNVPNQPPVWDDDPAEDAVNFNHCAQGSYQLSATDPDLTGTVTYSFDPVFDDGLHGEVTPEGAWTWSGATVPQSGAVDIEFRAFDTQDYTLTNFTLHVTLTNEAPQFDVCPSGLATVSAGTPRSQTLVFSDPDVCDAPAIVLGAVTNFNPANVNIVGGVVTFTPDVPARDVAMEIIVSDGELEDVCVLNWHVIEGSKYQVEIDKVEGALQGHFTDLDIILHSADAEDGLGGFDLLVAYDASALGFQLAIEGDLYNDGFYNWEYFTYRFGPYGNCGSACPSGMLRVVGLAEINNGVANAECVYDATAKPVLASLRFLVTNDRSLECQYVPVRFFWYDCTDNILSSCDGSVAYLSKKVYDYVDFNFPFQDGEMSNGTVGFPTYQGAQDTCVFIDEVNGKYAIRDIDFQNGGIDIVCADSIDARGDINLNGLPYEIADAVMFTNYFINGLNAFTGNMEGSIAASDCNADGIALSVADLVYLIRVVIGDAAPYDKAAPVAANITFGNERFNVDVEMGAAHIVMEGNVVPTLLADNMEMLYASNGQTTSILVYSTEANQSFRGDFLEVDGNVVSTEFATFTGATVAAKVMPSSFEVAQNYPNPFNPTTTFKFTVPNGGDWKLGVYNITGQLVESFSGVSETGYETVVWDASNLSSGIYFYRVSADNQSVTKKAVLLK
ncbi:MAG: T9SS type A sorting domain-containing protein [candidate division Zixibacteria bacterium]|nr:T9SS type A sorting domain-containing protein [candidate division Zixibacteria bacterium]